MAFSLKNVSWENISAGNSNYQESQEFISPFRQSGNSFQWNEQSSINACGSLTSVHFEGKEMQDGRYFQNERGNKRERGMSAVSYQRIPYSCEVEQSYEHQSQFINEIDSLQLGSHLNLDQPQTSMYLHLDSNRQDNSASLSFSQKQFNEFADLELSSVHIDFSSREQNPHKLIPNYMLTQSIPRNSLLVLPANNLQKHNSQPLQYSSSFMLQGDCLLDLSYLENVYYGQKYNALNKSALNHWKQCFSVSKDKDQKNGLFFYSLQSIRDYSPREQIEAANDFLLKLKSQQLTNSTIKETHLSKEISRIQSFLQKKINCPKLCSQLQSEKQLRDRQTFPTQQKINQELINQQTLISQHNLFSEEQTNEIRYVMKTTQELNGKMNSFLFGQVFSQNENDRQQQQLVQLVYSAQLFNLLYPNNRYDEDLSTSYLQSEGLFDFLDPRSRLRMTELQLRASFQVGFIGEETEERVVLLTKDGHHVDADLIVKVKKLPNQQRLFMIIYNFKVKIKDQKLLAALRKEHPFNTKQQQYCYEQRRGEVQVEEKGGKEFKQQELLLECQLKKKRKTNQPSDQVDLSENQSVLQYSPESAFLNKFYPELLYDSKRNVHGQKEKQ